MNKTTLIALGMVIVLGVVVFFVTREAEPEAMATLSLPAILTEVKKDDDKKDEATKDDTPVDAKDPADRIVFKRQGLEVELKRTGESDKWQVTKPFPGIAETYKVRAMLRVFKTATESVYARTVGAESLSRFGLDEDNAISVSVFRGEEKYVDILVGYVDKKENMDPDTLVMLPGGDIVFRMKEKDLRTPFDLELKELRDKKVFSFKKDDVVKIEVEDPRKTLHPRFVLEKRVIKGEGDAKDKDDWILVEPKNTGWLLENAGSFASSLANARSEDFMAKLPGADATALDKAYKITATVKREGSDKEETFTLMLGAGRKKGVYAQVGGQKEYFIITKYNADQLMKSLRDMRQKKLFSFKPADVVGLHLTSPEGTVMELAKRGEDWNFVLPAGQFASSSKVKSLSSNIANFRVAEYLDTQPSAAETGLADNPRRVTARLAGSAGGGSVTLLVGKGFKNDKDQDRYWAALEGQNEVFTIMKYSAQNLEKTLDDLKDMRVFRIKKEDVVELSLSHPDQNLTFVKEIKEGKEVWNMTAPKAKAGVELTAYIATLASLDISKFVEGKSPADVGLGSEAFTVSAKMKDGTVHSVTLSEEVKDNENFALSSTESGLAGKIFTVSKYKVENLSKKLPDFDK